MTAIQQSSFTYTPSLNTDTFEELRATGVEFTTAQLDALLEAAQRLQDSSDFVAWLPEGRSMQLELIGTHNSRLQRAIALLELLQAE